MIEVDETTFIREERTCSEWSILSISEKSTSLKGGQSEKLAKIFASRGKQYERPFKVPKYPDTTSPK
jgi:hypothetical protein